MSWIFEAVKNLEQRSTVAERVIPAGAVISGATTLGSTGSELSGNAPVAVAVPPTVSLPRQERRKQKRASMNLGVRVRPADPKDGDFKEILKTVNASRQGLYFTTATANYYPGMSLHVAFPYNSAHDSVTVAETDADVARLEPLPDGRSGVAILLRGPAEATRSAPALNAYSHGRTGDERRHSARYPFSAMASVTCVHSKLCQQARCSDLGLNGCYVDTLNPFPAGTRVQLQLAREDRNFETAACVRSSHMGMGMGLIFQDPTPDHTAVLIQWLGGEGGSASSSSTQHTAKPALMAPIAKPALASDNAPVVSLILLLHSKGILTAAEVSSLLPILVA